mmetsp:Transcript_68499/g.135371  ORF Transcript_68499/g.135371 Transcript_68499/m.135371 type:complete len:273 (+) Transcript_68499:102-920(+)
MLKGLLATLANFRAPVVEDDEPESMDSLVKIPFEVKLTFVTAVVLFHPVVLIWRLFTRNDVFFLLGGWAAWVAAVVPPWVMLCHISMHKKAIPFRVAPIIVLVLPAAILAITCQLQSWQFAGQQVQLTARDCESFPVKARLERSWWRAYELWDSCTKELARTSGASQQEVKAFARFESCSEYRPLILHEDHLANDWKFLAETEHTHHCGGWCTVQPSIWRAGSPIGDSCSMAVARVFVGTGRMSFQATVYVGLLLMSTSVALVLRPNWSAGL